MLVNFLIAVELCSCILLVKGFTIFCPRYLLFIHLPMEQGCVI